MAAIPEEFAIENAIDFDPSVCSRMDNHRRRFVVDAERLTERKLWMVWLVSPVSEKNLLAVGFAVLFARNFSRYKC